MSEDPMWCMHHDDAVDWNEFEFKGCWGCEYFTGLDTRKHVYTHQAAKLLGVATSTVRHWLRNGLLEGTLYKRGRREFSMSSPPMKYVVDRASIEELRGNRKRKPSEASQH